MIEKPPSSSEQSSKLFSRATAVYAVLQSAEPLDEENSEQLVTVLRRIETIARDLRESVEEMIEESK